MLALDTAFVQLREPITIAAGSLDYACLPLIVKDGAWYNHLPSRLEAMGWGWRDPENSLSFPNRLHYVTAVTRALPEWSFKIRMVSDYEGNPSELERKEGLYIFSPKGTNGTMYYGDSGGGIVLRRHQQPQSTDVVAAGDLLYGHTIAQTTMEYSLNEEGGEPEKVRIVNKATPIQHIADGWCRYIPDTRSSGNPLSRLPYSL